MLQNIPFPILPVPPSWYPGHMTQFSRMLPALLRRTDVVLELRDSRLPLTSINRNFEGAFSDLGGVVVTRRAGSEMMGTVMREMI